jgi:hypothetical protein
MSKHISRKERWTQESSTRYTSSNGTVVYEKQAWFAVFHYRLRQPESTGLAMWIRHTQRLGPFKRPRNAMVALEREVTLLRNRHGKDILVEGEVWAEV